MDNDLGLPLEYSELHEYYDALCAGNTATINQFIEDILSKYQVKTILDLSCGTGAQALWLAKHGYQVTGSDLSPSLLTIAKAKAQQENLAVHLIEGDMRTIQIGSFDAAITIFNAIGHLSKTDFEQAMRNISQNLTEGGIYIFDIFNLDAMTDDVVAALAMDTSKTVNDTQIHHIQQSTINKNHGQLTSYDTFTIQQESQPPKIIKGKFTLQIYTAAELRAMLARNGFIALGQYSIDGGQFIEQKTTNIVTVAMKDSM